MKNYIVKKQSILTIFYWVLVVLSMQACSDDSDNFDEFEPMQILQGEWRINEIIGYPKGATNLFTLTKVDRDKEEYVWGMTIKIEDEKFVCVSSAPCGNDCFPSSKGKIGKAGSNRVKIFVENFDQEGMIPECKEIHLKLNKTLGIYSIKKISATKLQLVRTK